MSERFVYKLVGGPYDGKEVSLSGNQQWRVEIPYHDAYAQNNVALAVYGRRHYAFSDLLDLVYWGKKNCEASAIKAFVPWRSDVEALMAQG
jgi:hypothetical protein